MPTPERLTLPGDRPAHVEKDKTIGGPSASRIMTRTEALELVTRWDEMKAKGRKPADWVSWLHGGVALQIAGRTEEGIEALRRSVEMSRNAVNLGSLAVALENLGKFDEAFTCYCEAVRIDPTNQFAGLGYAQSLLRQGNWRHGWEPFEWYSWGTLWEDELGELIPKWEGEALAGEKILVIQNGGFGDNLMFMRWLKNLKDMGAHVTYACPDVMMPVLEDHPWIDQLLPTREGYEGADTPDLPEVDFFVKRDGKKQFDYFVPMMGLAKRFAARVDTLRWPGPYIFPDPEKVAVRKYVLNAPQRPFKKIGVCWMGAERLDPRRHRSLDVEQASRLLSYRGVDWISLQYGVNPPVGGEHIFNPQMKDWSDTAAIVECCDLVVTVDTGVMHLAGAMGKPTWALIPGLSDWKFLLNRNDMVFYPSVRLFRNHGEGLEDALDQLMDALTRFTLKKV